MHDTHQNSEPPTVRRRPSRLAASMAAGTLAIGLTLGAAARDLPFLPGPAAPAAAQISSAAGITDLERALVSTAERVGPAVVSIRTDRGLGSGVIYDPSGLILTNAHVVDAARAVTVRLSDGRRLDGRVLGRDTGFDLAVIKVDEPGLRSAPLGQSSALRVGQIVVAIGNPYGFDHTVTNGVVSALNRPIAEGQQSYAQPMIQTNAAINPGNSGGPLVDLQGNVIGINTLVAAPQGFPAQGLGFAVPADTARRIAPQLAEGGKVAHSGQPYLGVSVSDTGTTGQAARAQRGQQPASPTQRGAQLQRVEPNGPAAAAGLQIGDVITRFGDKEVHTGDDFLQNLVLRRPGERVTITALRNGQSSAYTVTIGEAPPRVGA